jgi:hypothetical protein
MKKMAIYEPAMCCSTGLCGVGVNPDLLRISTILNALNKQGVVVDRYNLTSAPMKFVTNLAINNLINKEGVAALPATVVDGQIVIKGRYPTNEEIAKWLNVSVDLLDSSEDRGHKGGNCQ